MKGIEIVFLAVGGLAGTFLRFSMTKTPSLFLGVFPINILVVNIIGSFILGSFAILSQQWHLDQKYALLIAVGFCGALTTMSSFALETSNLMDSKQYSLTAINIITNVGFSLGAIFGGRILTSMILVGLK